MKFFLFILAFLDTRIHVQKGRSYDKQRGAEICDWKDVHFHGIL